MALTFAGCGSTENASTTASTTADTTPSTTAATDSTTTAATDPSATASESNVLGEGETAFTLTVIDPDGNETSYEIHTDETTVGAALVALELVSGEDSDYGLYVTTVNGITLDWDTDGMYWAFYIDGEYAMTGVDSTDIVAGTTYTLKAE